MGSAPSCQKSFKNKPIEFSSKELMLNYAKAVIKKKFNFNLDNVLAKSILLKQVKQQSKLTKFLHS